MKKRIADIWRAVGLLVVFVVAGTIGVVLAMCGLGVWKASRFTTSKWTVGEDVASARFLVLLGGGIFVVCALCVFNLLRYDLGNKRRIKK